MQSQRSLWKSLYPQLSQPCKQMWNFLEQNWLKYFQLQGFFKILFKIFFTKSVKMFPIYSVLILLKFLFKVRSQINKLTRSTTYNAVISPNFLVWKFAERYSFRIVSEESPETIRKLCLSAKFPHQENRWNYSILQSDPKYATA